MFGEKRDVTSVKTKIKLRLKILSFYLYRVKGIFKRMSAVLDFGPFVRQLRLVDKTWQTRRNVVRKFLKVRPTATLLTKSSHCL